MYLLDTNILLELLLDRDKASEVERFLRRTPPDRLFITEFSFYSIGIFLLQQKKPAVFLNLVSDLVTGGNVQILRLRPSDMKDLVKASRRFKLDFDDAYQYVSAQKNELTLVSYDAHFDRTARGRKTPGDLV